MSSYSRVKMKTGSSLLIMYFLLLLQSTGGFTYICGAYNERPSSIDVEQCTKVEEVFENALLNNKSNLYILRTTLLSSSNPSPHMLKVIYNFADTSSITALWSSSQVFTVIDPAILHDLQSGIMSLVYYLDGILFPQTIYLYLNFSENHFNPEENEYGILTITEKLKVYATYQGKLSNWDGQDKGYVLLPMSTSSQPLRQTVEFPTVISITILIVIVGIAYSWKLIKRLSELEEGYDMDIKLTLFWSFTSVLAVTNFIDIIISLIIVIINSMSSRKQYCVIILKIVLTLIVAILGALLGMLSKEKNMPKFPPIPHSPDEECCLSFEIRKRIDYTCTMCNIFLFVYLIGISIISTTALMVVYPILVLSTVAYVITSMFSIVALLALSGLTLNRLGIHQNYNDFRQKNCSQLCNGCLQITAIIAISLIILLYLIILSKDDRTYTSGFLQGISSFLPSIVLTVISYYAKNKLTANKRAKYKKSTSSDSESESAKLLPNTEETKL